MSKYLSDKDREDWENFTSAKDKLPDKEIKNKVKVSSKTETIDLHGYTLENANKYIEEIILKSHHRGINKLIVITGKGIHSQNDMNPYVSKDLSILKYSVPDFIKKNTILMRIINEIKDANYEDGGSGAFYIFLKKKYNNKI